MFTTFEPKSVSNSHAYIFDTQCVSIEMLSSGSVVVIATNIKP